ncbi:MAG: hypothetical protein PVH89_00580 [Gammaproteobacteria bacterium]|jgi:hypothetical protein
MRIDRDQAFRELEPPPGGAARLRAGLAAGRPRRGIDAWWLGPVAALSVAIIAVVAFLSVPEPDPVPEVDELMAAAAFDRLLGRESVPFELQVRRGTESLAIQELEGSNPEVRLYSLSPPEPTAGP